MNEWTNRQVSSVHLPTLTLTTAMCEHNWRWRRCADDECVMQTVVRPGAIYLFLSVRRSGHTGLFPLSVMGMIHSVDSKNRPERRRGSERARFERSGRRTGGGGGGNRGRELTWSDLTPTSRRPSSLLGRFSGLIFRGRPLLICFAFAVPQRSRACCPAPCRAEAIARTQPPTDGQWERLSAALCVQCVPVSRSRPTHHLLLPLAFPYPSHKDVLRLLIGG